MSAIAVNEAGLMKRPTRYDECVTRRAAEMALPELRRWHSDIGTDDDVIESLMKHIGRHGGYEIVKSLEDDGWCGDSSLVEIMDQNFIGDAEDELVKQWVKCLGVKLDIPIGTKVRIKKPRWSIKEEFGEVTKHYPETAKYGVRTPDQAPTANWILLPEDVEYRRVEPETITVGGVARGYVCAFRANWVVEQKGP